MSEFINVKLVTTAFGNLTYLCNHIMCTIMYNTLFKTIHELAISPTRLRNSTSEIHHWFGQFVFCPNCWLCWCPQSVWAFGIGYFSTCHFGSTMLCSDDIAIQLRCQTWWITCQPNNPPLLILHWWQLTMHSSIKTRSIKTFHKRNSITSFFEDSLQPQPQDWSISESPKDQQDTIKTGQAHTQE